MKNRSLEDNEIKAELLLSSLLLSLEKKCQIVNNAHFGPKCSASSMHVKIIDFAARNNSFLRGFGLSYLKLKLTID